MGKIINFVNVDMMSIRFYNMLLIFCVPIPLVVIICIVTNCMIIGPVGLVMPVVFIIQMYFQGFVSRTLFKMIFGIRQCNDKRTKLVNEYI